MSKDFTEFNASTSNGGIIANGGNAAITLSAANTGNAANGMDAVTGGTVTIGNTAITLSANTGNAAIVVTRPSEYTGLSNICIPSHRTFKICVDNNPSINFPLILSHHSTIILCSGTGENMRALITKTAGDEDITISPEDFQGMIQDARSMLLGQDHDAAHTE